MSDSLSETLGTWYAANILVLNEENSYGGYTIYTGIKQEEENGPK